MKFSHQISPKSDNSDHLALGTSESLSNNGVDWAGSACDHLHQDERAGYACGHLSYEEFKNDSETNCGGRCSPAVGFSTQISIDNPKADGSEEATSYSCVKISTRQRDLMSSGVQGALVWSLRCGSGFARNTR